VISYTFVVVNLKNKRTMRFLFITIAVFIVSNIRATNEIGLEFCNITNQEGLPTDEVTCIYQDKEGFIWIGTRDGLCRWDGYEIKTYKSDYHNPNLLTNNWVNCIAEDQNNQLWIGTQWGVTILDKSTGRTRFVDRKKLSNHIIYKILITEDHTVWIATNFGLNRYIPASDSFVAYFHNPEDPKSICGNDIKILLEDSKGQIWIGTWQDGLCRYNVKEDNFILYPRINKRNSAHYIFEDKQHNIWIGSWECGLYRMINPYEPLKTVYVPYISNNKTKSSLSDNTVYSISQDDVYGYLWVGTPKGLNILTDIENSNSFVRYDKESKRDFYENDLNSIFKDNSGGMWLGFLGKGIKAVTIGNKVIKNYPLTQLLDRENSRSVFAINEISDNVVWLGMKLYGVVKYDRKNNKYISFPNGPVIKDINEKMNTVTFIGKVDKPDEVWVASSYTGIYIVKTDGIRDFAVRNISTSTTKWLVNDAVNIIYKDKQNNIWIGTEKGFSIFGRKDSLSIYSIENMGDEDKSKTRHSIITILQDDVGYVWLGTEDDGIYKTSFNGGKLKDISIIRYNTALSKVNNNNIQCLFEDSKQRIWAGTKGGGLSMYNRKLDRFIMIDNMAEIPGDIIFNIIEDNVHNLWLSTNRGLVCHNVDRPKNKQIKVYTVNDGLQDNVFIHGACFKSNKGELFFGGHNGFNSFLPEEIVDNKFLPATVITKITFFGVSLEDLPFNVRGKMSECLPNYTRIIKVPHNLYNFTIEFSGLSFSNPGKNRYAYMLEGFDKEWQYVDANHRYANYNNLHKGKYVFKVKSANESGKWNEQAKTVIIEILPAYYETWYAYLLYAFFIIAIAYVIYRIIVYRIKLNNALKLEHMERSKQEEMNQMKLHFFTNVSHELLTPLTIISCTVDDMQKTFPDKQGAFNTLKLNINRLMRLLEQILEFRKAESDNLRLLVSKGDISTFIQKICAESFAPLAKKCLISLSVECFPESLMGWFDPDKVDKIMYNLLSNAFKYNYEGGNVSITLEGIKNANSDEAESVLIQVYNTGEGIPKENIPNLFKRFYEGDYRKFKTKGVGIGLALTKSLVELHKGSISVKSELNRFTEFSVVLPISQKNFSNEQIDSVGIVEHTEIIPVENNEHKSETIDKTGTLLLVEDNLELLNIMQSTLSNIFSVITATNGYDGLELAKKENPDIVITDILMPNMNGLELCKVLKNEISTSHISVILLTAKVSSEDKIEGYQLGADAYITKPFELSILEAQIKSILINRKRYNEKFKTMFNVNEINLNFTSIDEQFLNKAIKLIENNLANPDFDLAMFQKEMNATGSMLYRKFKSLTGMAPLEFVRNIRMKASCRIFTEKKCNITEVAYAVGFNDPKYFSACFKKEFGISPMEYIESLQR
jgi:signal transduction histidine kinase/ligand-binding sensor domain-containing protein/AraC-like DNA-binding protein